MADLIAELEGVVRLIHTYSNDKSVVGVRRASLNESCLYFLRTHHAEIAAAVRDKRRLDWLERDCTDIPDELGMARQLYFGTYSSGQTLREAVDTAMRAGEGDG